MSTLLEHMIEQVEITATCEAGECDHAECIAERDNPTKYNHAYTIAFEIISDDETGMKVSVEALRAALLRRLDGMGEDEVIEAIGAPYDTVEETS